MRPSSIEKTVAWDLRGAWARRRQVVVVMDARSTLRRVRGYVEHVAPTDAFALVWDGQGNVHVPLALVDAVRRPHFHEPTDGVSPGPAPMRQLIPLQLPGQLALFEGC